MNIEAFTLHEFANFLLRHANEEEGCFNGIKDKVIKDNLLTQRALCIHEITYEDYLDSVEKIIKRLPKYRAFNSFNEFYNHLQTTNRTNLAVYNVNSKEIYTATVSLHTAFDTLVSNCVWLDTNEPVGVPIDRQK